MIRRALARWIGRDPRGGEADADRPQTLTRQDVQVLLREELAGMAPLT